MKKNFRKVLCTTLAVVMLVGMLTVFANAADTTFTDVTANDWFYDDVTACANKGYVSGVGNNKFEPNGKLTNAQVMTMFVNAIYKNERQDYETNRYLEMDAYFDGNTQWWSYNCYYFKDNGLLDGTNVNIKSTSSVSEPISRYEVVQIANNILKDKGIVVSIKDRDAARSKITDRIPTIYNEAVTSCYALGILNGYDDGRFAGDDSLTRAQACVILNKLVAAIENGPSAPTTPTTGVLANGKPITEENVMEIFAEVEKEYPTGTLWTRRTVPGTAYNPNPVSRAVRNSIGRYADTTYACGGFAAMVSDRVFGYGDSNPARVLDDISKIRPGDIIIEFDKNNKAKHVQIAMSNPFVNNGFTGIYVAEGNLNDQVCWSTAADTNVLWHTKSSNWVVYTRYPD